MTPSAHDLNVARHPDRYLKIMLNSELNIGTLTIPNRVILAPLVGVSDLPFRRICAEMGAGMGYVEMLSYQPLIHGARTTGTLLARHASERLLGAQLTGPTPEKVADAIAVLEGYPLDTIDINMGCPVRKVVARKSGSAILQDPRRVSRTIELALQRTTRPITAKIRLGYKRNEKNVTEIVRRLAAGGVSMISIHGRTREDRYDVAVDYDSIAAGVAAARAEVGAGLPVIGNGDILDAASADIMLERTGCDGLMISRGVLGNPWIFAQILTPGTPQPTVAAWRRVLMRHLGYHSEHFGTDAISTAPFRKHLLWYASGFPGMRRLRERLARLNHPDEIFELLDDALKQIDPETRRFTPTARARPEPSDPAVGRFLRASDPTTF
jgi:tRNA-dihydrouridine synthase B